MLGRYKKFRIKYFINEIIPKYFKIYDFVPSKGKILDVGCGEGNLSKVLLKKDVEITGCDLGSSIKLKNKRFNYLKRDLNKGLNLKEVFDCIIFADVLEHLKEPSQMLKEVSTMTNHIVVSIPNMGFFLYKLIPSLENPPKPQVHLHHWKLKEFLKILPKEWDVRSVKYATDWPELKLLGYVFPNISFFNQTLIIDLRKKSI